MKIVKKICAYSPNVFVAIIVVLLTAQTAMSQNQNEITQKFSLAQQLQKQGDNEQAMVLYRELYKMQPNNIVFVNNYMRLLENFKLYEEWIKIIDERLILRPNDPTMFGEKARALYLSGKELQAMDQLEKIIQINPDNQTSYSMASSYFQRIRLYNEAIAVLQRGREHLKNPKLFSNILAGIYQYRRNYKMSTREWLNWVTMDKRYFSMVERTISSFPPDSEIVADVTIELERIVADSSQNAQFRSLLSGYYIKNKEYGKAFDSYKILDEMTKSGGGKILAFADQIFLIGSYEYATKAYSFFLDNFPDVPTTGKARLGLAKSCEQEGYNSSIENPDSLQLIEQKRLQRRALAEYYAITRVYQKTAWALEAHYRLGHIRFNYMFDVDGAIKEYENVRIISPKSNWAYESTLRIGDSYVTKGNIPESGKYYGMLQNLNLPNSDIKLRAKYKLLLNDYYMGSFEKLRADLDTLLTTSPLNKNLSNDLITLLLFLDENLVGDQSLVRSYAESEFMVRQHKIARALNRLSVLYPAASGHPIADDILALMAKLQLDTGQPEGAVLTLRNLINDFPFSPLTEKAHLDIARLYAERLNKPELAAVEYEQFLRNYSRSIYLDEAREKLRKLQKNRN